MKALGEGLAAVFLTGPGAKAAAADVMDRAGNIPSGEAYSKTVPIVAIVENAGCAPVARYHVE